MYNDIVNAREQKTSHTVLAVRGGVYVEMSDAVCVGEGCSAVEVCVGGV